MNKQRSLVLPFKEKNQSGEWHRVQMESSSKSDVSNELLLLCSDEASRQVEAVRAHLRRPGTAAQTGPEGVRGTAVLFLQCWGGIQSGGESHGASGGLLLPGDVSPAPPEQLIIAAACACSCAGLPV